MDPKKINKFTLDDLKKENPFQVPENYFDSLGARIADKIEATAPREKEPVFAFARLKPILVFSGGFAGLALVIFLGFSVFFNKADKKNTLANAELASLNEYALVSELDEALLIQEFSEPATIATDTLYQEIKEQHIIDYLMQEDIDITTIIEEL